MRWSSTAITRTVVGGILGVAVVVGTALTSVPTQAVPTQAASTQTAPTAPQAPAPSISAPSISVAKKARGVQSGSTRQRITASVSGRGRVVFTLAEVGATTSVSRTVLVRAGRAVYRVPALSAGRYRVTASWGGRRAATRFTVYDATLRLNATSFTFSRSQVTNAFTAYPHLRGRVRVDGRPATGGYVDFYLGDTARGGSASPDFLGFTPIAPGGRFDTEEGFGEQVVRGPSTGLAGGHLDPLPNGTYTFRASYTDDKTYGDYISSALITVVVTD